MTDNTPNGFGRATTHYVPDNQKQGTGAPGGQGSIGTGRRSTTWIGAQEEQRGPGLPSQEQMAGRVPNQVMRQDRGNAIGVHAVPRPTTLTPESIMTVQGVEMKVAQAIEHGLIDPASVGMADRVAPQKSKAMLDHEARQRGEQPEQTAEQASQAAVDKTLHSSYVEVATELDKAMTEVGADSEAILTALASDQPTIDAAMVAKVAEKLGGPEQFESAVEAMRLHVYAAAERALPAGADLDQVLDQAEDPRHARRWNQAWTHLLRTGNSDLIAAFVKELAGC